MLQKKCLAANLCGNGKITHIPIITKSIDTSIRSESKKNQQFIFHTLNSKYKIK